MELEDYGDLTHKHTHLHTVPKIHQNTVNTALKDWCLEIFDEEKCKKLNESNFDEIITGSNQKVELSKVYTYLLDLENLEVNKGNENFSFKIYIRGTKIFFYKKINKFEEIYDGEIIYDSRSNELYSYVFVKSHLFPSDSNSNISPSDSYSDIFPKNNIHNTIKIIISNDGFTFNKNKFEYDNLDNTNIVENLKNELKRMDLQFLLKENRNKIDENKKKYENIENEKIKNPDNLTPVRNMDNYEKLDDEIWYELLTLIFYLVIGLSFCVYCILFFFTNQLK